MEKYSQSSIRLVRQLVEICKINQFSDVVISPGSRNAPLSISFSRHPFFNCEVLHDERSAAYYALGRAQARQSPVILLCTSGTASLNYYPAIAEAFYQRIPLCVITADRPPAWIDQMDGQTIRQNGVFAQHCITSVNLLLDYENEDANRLNMRQINEALQLCNGEVKGPIHINFPLEEPLYQFLDCEPEKVFTYQNVALMSNVEQQAQKQLNQLWIESKKKMIVVGMSSPCSKLAEILATLSADPNLIILHDVTANLANHNFIQNFDPVIRSIVDEEVQNFCPNLLVYIGGQVVSKEIKLFLRQHRPDFQWRVDPAGNVVDTFKSLSHLIKLDPKQFLASLSLPDERGEKDNSFQSLWKKRKDEIQAKQDTFFANKGHSDFQVFSQIHKRIPAGFRIHFSNSMPVRYAQFFKFSEDTLFYANRGTSGIDGCISTAVGHANASQKDTLLITGDTAFFYDINALWNKNISGRLKIILLNNQGGGIFRILDDSYPVMEREEVLEAMHQRNAEALCQSFGLKYFKASTEQETSEQLDGFFQDSDCCSLLEIFTEPEKNREIFKDYYKQVLPKSTS